MNRRSENIRVDIVSVPFSGHLYPLIDLINHLLIDEKYQVRVFTGPSKVEYLREKGIECVPILPDKPTIMEDIANTESAVKSNGLALFSQLKQNMSILPDIIDQLKEDMRKNGTDIIIADFVAAPAGIVAKELNIPWITTNPSPFTIETKKGVPAYIGGLKPLDSPVGKCRDYLGRLIVRTFKRTVVWVLRKDMAKMSFTLYNKKGEENVYSPQSILGLGMKEIEFNTDFPKQFKFVGACLGSLEDDVTIHFTEGNYPKRIFITMGTHLKWIKKSLIHLIQTLAEDYPHYLFVISEGESERLREDPVNLGENVWVYPYVPYSAHIPLFDIVIHHGGVGIFYQCVMNEKPAIILPQDYDQFDYAARGEEAGIAYASRKLNKKAIRKVFKQTIEKEDWPELERLSHQLKRYTPRETLVAEVDRLIVESRK